jgi:hypothetical protein
VLIYEAEKRAKGEGLEKCILKPHLDMILPPTRQVLLPSWWLRRSFTSFPARILPATMGLLCLASRVTGKRLQIWEQLDPTFYCDEKTDETPGKNAEEALRVRKVDARP